MLDGRNGKLQQLRESRSAGPLPGGAQQHFAGFPVHLPRLALPGKQGLQPLTYLAGDLLKDRNSRFFPPVSRRFPTARADPDRSSHSPRSVQRSASEDDGTHRFQPAPYAKAVGEENDSATVFPSTFRVNRIWGSCPGSLGLAQ